MNPASRGLARVSGLGRARAAERELFPCRANSRSLITRVHIAARKLPASFHAHRQHNLTTQTQAQGGGGEGHSATPHHHTGIQSAMSVRREGRTATLWRDSTMTAGISEKSASCDCVRYIDLSVPNDDKRCTHRLAARDAIASKVREAERWAVPRTGLRRMHDGTTSSSRSARGCRAGE